MNINDVLGVGAAVQREDARERQEHNDRMATVTSEAEQRQTLAKQCRHLSTAIRVLHALRDILMNQATVSEGDIEDFKKAFAKVRAYEAVVEARLRGL